MLGVVFCHGADEFGPPPDLLVDDAGKRIILSLAGGTTRFTSGTVSVLAESPERVELRALRQRTGHVDPRAPRNQP